MHFYQFHIGDYKSHTHHLSLTEDLAFRRLLDHYYLHEVPIKQLDIARQIGMRDNEQDVLTVLDEFFVSTEAGYINPRADEEISKYRKFSEDGKKGAAMRWQKPPNGEANSPPNATPMATNNQEPITNNHKPILACPVEKLIDVYHTAFPDGSRVKVITAARRAAAKARWLEASRLNVQPFRYANEAEGLAAWRKFFEVCAESDFLTGKVAPQAGRQTWVADFDFFMQPSSFAKCLENKYHREIAA